MSTSPERRPSITRPHPARAAAEAARAADEPPVPAEATEETESAEQDQPKRGRPGQVDRRLRSGKPSYAGKAVTVYFPTAEDRDRVQAAFRARGGIEGYTSFSDWVADLALERAGEWETKHNAGRSFTEVVTLRRRRR